MRLWIESNKENSMLHILTLVIVLEIIVLFPIQSFSLSFTFFSHSTIEGYIYDTNGNPISNVEVKSAKDNNVLYLEKNKIAYHVFSDSSGHFQLNLILEDVDRNGFANLDKKQKILCLKYCNESSRNYHYYRFDKRTAGSTVKLNENIYKRKVGISFSKIGYSDLVLDTSINCKMDKSSSPDNLFDHIVLTRKSDDSTVLKVNSKEYFESKFTAINGDKNTFIINNRVVLIEYKIDKIDDLFNPNYEFDDIKSKFRKSNYYLLSGDALSISVCIGIVGLSFFHDKENLYYPIGAGLALYSTGVLISYINTNNRRKLIVQYNERLFNKLKQYSN
jgi:hypothetical protein